MANVLFVTWDGGGNVPPALGIAAELHDRGERVRFLGHEQQRAVVEGAGFHFEPYRHARPWASADPAFGHGTELTIFEVFTDPGLGEDLLANVEREPADLVVIDCLLLGALGAADAIRAGARRAVLVHTFYDYLASSWSRGPVRQFGLAKGQDPVRLWAAADLMVVAAAPELDPSARAAPRALPANACYTGPVVRVPDPPPPPPTDGTPRILVSLSTTHFPGQAGVLQAILDALADLPVTGVVTTGPAVDPGQLRAPGNCELYRYVPHDDMLPGVSLVISHGGHATAMRALAWGRPLLIIPMHPMLDQPMIGQAISEAGAGEILPNSASPARIGRPRRDCWPTGRAEPPHGGLATASARPTARPLPPAGSNCCSRPHTSGRSTTLASGPALRGRQLPRPGRRPDRVAGEIYREFGWTLDQETRVPGSSQRRTRSGWQRS